MHSVTTITADKIEELFPVDDMVKVAKLTNCRFIVVDAEDFDEFGEVFTLGNATKFPDGCHDEKCVDIMIEKFNN